MSTLRRSREGFIGLSRQALDPVSIATFAFLERRGTSLK
jgi:hypothetical protein